MPISTSVRDLLATALSNAGVPGPVQEALQRAADEIADHYAAGHLRPTELSGGDFAEAVLRAIEHIGTGKHTPLTRSLPQLDRLVSAIEQYTGVDDSMRIHVPRAVRTIYDIRNRRGVAHIPAGITANQSDAELILATVKWVMVEFIRVYHAAPHNEAQRLVDTFVISRPALVEVFDGEPRIVTRSELSSSEKILVLLFWREPEKSTRQDLGRWLRDVDSSNLTKAVKRLESRTELHITREGRIHLTSRGRTKAQGLIAQNSARR